MLLTKGKVIKHRIAPVAIYAITTFACFGYFDGIYGGEPIHHHLSLIHLATFGASLFALACVLSLFRSRFGVACALGACLLAWPYFALEVATVPWNSIISVLGFSNWMDKLASILMLSISTIYSLLEILLLSKRTEGRTS